MHKNKLDLHNDQILLLQNQLQNFWTERMFLQSPMPISLKYGSSSSYTTRSKSYKSGSHTLNCAALDQIIHIDPGKQIALVEPRVTMEALTKATLAHGFVPPVIPELKEITVGGAIMGAGAESASHRWGTFNDTCLGLEFLRADGHLVKTTPHQNADLFYALPGSYGSLGALVAAEIKLIPAKEGVHVRYAFFSSPAKAIERLISQSHAANAPDFLDGIIFSKNLAVVIEGNLATKSGTETLPHFSTQPLSAPFYHQHVQAIAQKHSSGTYAEWMSHADYYFRYDLGAFWMGAYLFKLPLVGQLFMQGILKWTQPQQNGFSPAEVQRFHQISEPNAFLRTLLRPLTTCKNLCKMLHKAEKWVQNRFMIQDFCIPEGNADVFLSQVLEAPAIFPIWLLPIKGTPSPQIFAPHRLATATPQDIFLNFGLYGIPHTLDPVEQITHKLEKMTHAFGGRKVLYSHSYYSPEEFWEIYSRKSYEALRQKTGATGFWLDITAKVLSA